MQLFFSKMPFAGDVDGSYDQKLMIPLHVNCAFSRSMCETTKRPRLRDGFDLRDDLSNLYVRETSKLESEMYKSVKRYTGQAFKRAKLKRQMKISEWVSGNTRCIFFSIMSDQCKNLIITMHWNIRTQKNFLMNLMQVKLDFYHEKNYAKDAPKSLIFSLRPVISSCFSRVMVM